MKNCIDHIFAMAKAYMEQFGPPKEARKCPDNN